MKPEPIYGADSYKGAGNLTSRAAFTHEGADVAISHLYEEQAGRKDLEFPAPSITPPITPPPP